MAKLIALYKRPENKGAFDEHYFNTLTANGKNSWATLNESYKNNGITN